MPAILACAFVLAGHLFAHAQTPSFASPLTIAEFDAALAQLVSALEQATPEEAGVLAAQQPLRWQVQTGDQTMQVDATWLLHALREASSKPQSWPAESARLRGRLIETRFHLTAYAARPGQGAAPRLRPALDEILARPEFRRDAKVNWLQYMQLRIIGAIRSLLDRLSAGRLARRETATVVVWAAAIAAFAVLALLLARLLNVSSGTSSSLNLARGLPRIVSAREWSRLALAAARAGDVREAIRCAHNASLRRLEEEGAWRLDLSRTPREYLRLLKADDARMHPVRDLTEQFEQAWYGNRAVNDEDVARLGANLEKLGCLSASERAI